MSVIEEFEEKVPKKSKMGMGFCQLSSQLLGSIPLVAITYYYNIILGLEASLIAIGWLIFMIWNTVNDPIIGNLEDRIRGVKHGRRIPVIRIGAPFFALAFILCWIPLVDINNQFSLFLYFVAVLFIMDTMYTIVVMITYILPAEMAISSKGRGQLMIYVGIATTIGSLISIALPLFIFTGIKEKGINLNFIWIMILFGIISGIILFLSSYFITENRFTALEEPMGLIENIKTTFKNKPFKIYLIGYFCFYFAQQLLATAVFYYITFVLKISGIMAIIPIILFFLMIILFLPVWYKAILKFGLKKAYMLSLICMGFGFISLFFLGWVYITAIISLAIVGAMFSGYILMGTMLFGDVVDYDETKTGKRREASYAGIQAIFQKPAISLAPAVFLWIILAFGFNEAASTQTPTAQLGIILAFSIIPGAVLLLGGLSVYYYRLSGPEWMKQKAELKKIHDKKEAEYIQHLKEKGLI